MYVGSSIIMQRRWDLHERNMKCNVHNNTLLQEHYNLYGTNSLEVIVLYQMELTDEPSKLDRLEYEHCGRIRKDKFTIFNERSFKRAVRVELNGVFQGEFESIAEAGRVLELPRRSLHHWLTGECNSREGYTVTYVIYKDKD